MPRLHVKDLQVRSRTDELVRGVSFDLEAGQWLSIIGESGSGKSLTAAAITNLMPAGLTRSAAAITLDDLALHELSEKKLRGIRGRLVSYVFQDYAGAFAPYIRLGAQMHHAMRAHGVSGSEPARARIFQALEDVSLPPEQVVKSYSFQLSGGQLQRVALATAMLCRPSVLIADEPTTALDAVTQASVLELITELRDHYGVSVLFITHDLRCVVRYADTALVMHRGRVIEAGVPAQVAAAPTQDYTRNLFGAIPQIGSTARRLPVPDVQGATA